MLKLKRILKNIRIIILLVFLLFAVVAIHPNPAREGVAIRTVTINSSAALAGIENPKPNMPPMSREVIVAINNKVVKSIDDYNSIVSALEPDRTLSLKTTKKTYTLKTKPLTKTFVLNETEEKIITEIIHVNETINGAVVATNKTINRTVIVNKTQTEIVGTEDIGLKVYKSPKTNLRTGLDLQGGTRVLLQPEQKIGVADMESVISNIKQRLNVYGLTDIIVRETDDLSGNQYVLIEIAGANEEEVKELLAKQGKFEAKITNITIFVGGSDIKYVCRSADCAGIDPQRGCGMSEDNNWYCRFRFAISLSPEAAQKQADATGNLDIISKDGEEFLNETLMLYLDDVLVDELSVAADLKGKAVTDIEISGSGIGTTQQEAVFNSLKNMKRLQTILITGSLPVKLNIAKTDTISPVLGEEFLKNAIIMGLLAMVAVYIVLFLRYREFKISSLIICTAVFEITLLVGLAALIGWNLDLAAIAGIIITIGTGVNDQVVITDEVKRGEKEEKATSIKQSVQKAFFIITASYMTIVVAMLPLWFAGAGLLKGFAITTIFGITFGILITRPAYAALIEILSKE